jgi:hypothetical protein
MAAHNAAIMAVLGLVIGPKLIRGRDHRPFVIRARR